MVQNVSNQNQNSNLGSISRVGTMNSGREIYQITSSEGKVVGKMSVAPQDCDTFEKSYNTLIAVAPKLHEYTQNTPPEKFEKKQKMAKWIIAGGALLGGLWPALRARGLFKQISLTLLGSLAGLAGGIFVAKKIVTPPGAQEFAQATQTISKLDIQPMQ